MNHADLALAVSIISAATTAFLYWRSGARLVVRLRPALQSEMGALYEGPYRGWRQDGPFEDGVHQWVMELARVEVINVGRTAMSVSEISIDTGPTIWWKFWSRRTMSGLPVKVQDGPPEDPIRLDTGESVSLYFDFWNIVAAARRRQAGRVVVRGSVLPAGRRRRRSSWLKRWTIEPGQTTLRPWQSPSIECRMYRKYWRLVRHDTEQHLIAHGWYSIQGKLDRPAEEIAAALEEALGPKGSFIARELHGAYNEEPDEA